MDSQHLFLALTNSAPGKEDEFNKFYDEVHCDDVLGSDGWISAQRYRLASEQRPGQDPPWKYLAVYEVNLSDGTILAALQRRPDIGPRGKRQPPLWADGDRGWIYTKIGPRHVQGQA
jgi:hypothetical protein